MIPCSQRKSLLGSQDPFVPKYFSWATILILSILSRTKKNKKLLLSYSYMKLLWQARRRTQAQEAAGELRQLNLVGRREGVKGFSIICVSKGVIHAAPVLLGNSSSFPGEGWCPVW